MGTFRGSPHSFSRIPARGLRHGRPFQVNPGATEPGFRQGRPRRFSAGVLQRLHSCARQIGIIRLSGWDRGDVEAAEWKRAHGARAVAAPRILIHENGDWTALGRPPAVGKIPQCDRSLAHHVAGRTLLGDGFETEAHSEAMMCPQDLEQSGATGDSSIREGCRLVRVRGGPQVARVSRWFV